MSRISNAIGILVAEQDYINDDTIMKTAVSTVRHNIECRDPDCLGIDVAIAVIAVIQERREHKETKRLLTLAEEEMFALKVKHGIITLDEWSPDD